MFQGSFHEVFSTIINSTNQIDEKETKNSESILQLLVSEDLSTIKSRECLEAFFVNYLHLLPHKIVSEVLSVLIAIVKKSVFHFEAARGLLIPCIQNLVSEDVVRGIRESNDHGHQSSPSSANLTKHFLREWINLLITHSCNVQELKSILNLSENDPTLLRFIQQANLKQRNRPPAFFAFPGSKGSMIALPPLQKWPIQLGWSISTWFYLEPKPCAQPYLYNFKTGKSGLGYSAHFTGNCLVLTSIRVKGKGVQHCVAYEFPSYKWTHCAITYHNKWRSSEIKVYVDGQLAANIEIPWQVQTTEVYDKCFIGGSGTISNNDRTAELNCFCGQMSAIMLFSEGLSPVQICSIHRLGPSYMGQFRYSNESHVSLPPQVHKALYEEKLSSTLFCLYSPLAIDSGALCIQLAPFKSSTGTPSTNFFFSTPHAALVGRTRAIVTQPISSTLQSLGRSRSLLPLLDIFAEKGDSEACLSLIEFICDLLESSPHWFANEMVQNSGFVIIACALARDSRSLITERLLDVFLRLTRTMLSTSSLVGDSLLLKHIMDNILFNPSLWIYADPRLQLKLHTYLATEFLHGTRQTTNKYTIGNSNKSTPSAYAPTTSALDESANHGTLDDKSESRSPVVQDLLFGEIRRVSTVLQSLHALKYYYWIEKEVHINPKGRSTELRPTRDQLKVIRSNILSFTKELIVRSNTTPLDETQCILNYLSSCSHQDNIVDVLDLVSSLIREQTFCMIKALDQKHGIKVIFSLIGSKSEVVRIRALKLLALLLSQCLNKKKAELMGPHNLYMLLYYKLRAFRPLSFQTYQALVDILVEDDIVETPTDYAKMREVRDISRKRIENSMVIKVIASLLHEERIYMTQTDQKEIDIRKIFINDIWNLIVNSRDNRRTILQMSVWQHWLINLIDSTIDEQQLARDQVIAIFRVLLYHAVRYEYGGWRVWIDTLAIIHTKVSYDDFCHHLDKNLKSTSDLLKETSDQGLVDSTEKQSKYVDVRSADPKPVHQEDEINQTPTGTETSKLILHSISGRMPRESSGLRIYKNQDDNTKDEDDEAIVREVVDRLKDVDLPEDSENVVTKSESFDSVDLAPSRAFRRHGLKSSTDEPVSIDKEPLCQQISQVSRQDSLTSIPLEESDQECSKDIAPIERDLQATGSEIRDGTTPSLTETPSVPPSKMLTCDVNNHQTQTQQSASEKAIASPAFRIPEFRWSPVLIKLFNDLMFSIECDLYHWRSQSSNTNPDAAPFAYHRTNAGKGSSTTNVSAAPSSGTSSNLPVTLEGILQRAENQIYIINIIHFVSQLADNMIIAGGGLLPLLADATGGSRTSTSSNSSSPNSASSKVSPSQAKTTLCEGLTLSQANSLLYRLMSLVDMTVFAASHVSLAELEADKNTTSGGILRQCLRLACTVTVKNCLVIRTIQQKVAQMGIGGEYQITSSDLTRDLFDSYQGCSLLSANGLFEGSALALESSDLIASLEYTPHQMPNSSSQPSVIPFHTNTIRDSNKLLQSIDISRIQACIYHEGTTESRQSQFLALSSLYFISVLMVSRYRDIIEPKVNSTNNKRSRQKSPLQSIQLSENVDIGHMTGTSSSASVSSVVESNLLTFGKMAPNSGGNNPPYSSTTITSTGNSLTDMLTKKLESTLDTICPLLKTIMCDFCTFLSKTLIGSHGQDLVGREADRTFKRANTGPVELVMLLCSQEWQNTLQKNAGLAFIELINEGRVLSHGMKDHIVRVAMEAEFILSRLRADDVAKHERFTVASSELHSARLHEEALINSLINSAARRDQQVHARFRDGVRSEQTRRNRLDAWEDDDRRKRRFIVDIWDDKQQKFYSPASFKVEKSGEKQTDSNIDTATGEQSSSEQNNPCSMADTRRRILELQESIELGVANVSLSDTDGTSSGVERVHHAHPDAIGIHHHHQHDDVDDDDIEQDDDRVENDDVEDEESECEEDDDDEDDEDPDEVVERQTEPNGGLTERARITHEKLRHHNPRTRRGVPRGAPVMVQSKSARSKMHRASSCEHSLPVSNRVVGGGTGVDIVPGSGPASLQDIPSRHANPHASSQSTFLPNSGWDYDECGSVNEFTGSVVFVAECFLVWSIYAIPGILQLTNHELNFEPNQNIAEAIDSLRSQTSDEDSEEADKELVTLRPTSGADQSLVEQIHLRRIDLKVLRYCNFLACNGKIHLSDIRAIFSRHYLLQPHALELFLAQRTSVMFAFADFDTVKRVVKYLPPVGVGVKYGVPQSRKASLMTPRQLFAASDMTQKWQRREIGNFQYLMFLNTIAGRTYQDLNQYPVFPWILTNYDTDHLDLNLPNNFRDLSKPVGALNSKRRSEFMERYSSWDNPKVPAFHYGTHYSTAAFTLNWLCRLRGPLNSAYLALQDGKYEEPSRMFMSLADSWVSSLTGGNQNVRELIPEFFYLPELFHASLGMNPVELPPWANSSAEQFVRLHRLALESELVSCQLHQWIDLIFGYKQRGPEAVQAINTFYYLTYQGNVNLSMIQDPTLRDAIETQIKHFGQTPSQLTTEPHPPRFSALHVSPLVFSTNNVNEINCVVKLPFNTPVQHISSCISNCIAQVGSESLSLTSNGGANSVGGPSSGVAGGSNAPVISSILTITANNQYQIHKWAPASDQPGAPNTFSLDPQLEHPNSNHRRQLIDIEDMCTSTILKIGTSSAGSNKIPTTNFNNNTNDPELVTEVTWPCAHYVITLDGRYIIMGSFYDNSFRVFITENGKLCQVIYGHRGPITCMARSEGNMAADFYLATGSQDCSLLIWTWNDKFAQIEGSGVSAAFNPLPKLTISGHQTPVLSAHICAELGLVFSGSTNLLLLHTTTAGETLLEIDLTIPRLFERKTCEILSSEQLGPSAQFGHRPQCQDKRRTLLEASMIRGDESRPSSNSPSASSLSSGKPEKVSSIMSERFSHLSTLCSGDYHVTNIQLARELGFVVCIALPIGRQKSRQVMSTVESSNNDGPQIPKQLAAPLLMTFNLKGTLIDCTTIGQSANGPRLGDPCVLQSTRDGEHLVLNDSPTSLKVYRTFDLQPVYSFNTDDLPNSLANDHNRIRSIALLDNKCIVAGLDNGKIIIYNSEFKNLQ